MSKEAPVDEKQVSHFLKNFNLVTVKSSNSFLHQWFTMVMWILMFFANAITLNIAAFFLLLGVIMIWCPCVSVFPSLIVFDMHNLQLLGLNKLLNFQTVDVHRDVLFLTEHFIDEIRIVGLVVFIFAVILYIVTFFGCYSSATKNEKGTEFYTLICSCCLASLILFSMVYLNESTIENSNLVQRVECFLKGKYVPSVKRRSTMNDNFVDFFQSRLSCCGLHNGSNYLTDDYFHRIPLSCCKMMHGRMTKTSPTFFEAFRSCSNHPNDINSYIQIGCLKRVLVYINDVVARITFMFWILTFIGLTNWLIMRWSSKERNEKETAKITL